MVVVEGVGARRTFDAERGDALVDGVQGILFEGVSVDWGAREADEADRKLRRRD